MRLLVYRFVRRVLQANRTMMRIRALSVWIAALAFLLQLHHSIVRLVHKDSTTWTRIRLHLVTMTRQGVLLDTTLTKVPTRASPVHPDSLTWTATQLLRARTAFEAHILMLGLFRAPSVLQGQSTTTRTRRLPV